MFCALFTGFHVFYGFFAAIINKWFEVFKHFYRPNSPSPDSNSRCRLPSALRAGNGLGSGITATYGRDGKIFLNRMEIPDLWYGSSLGNFHFWDHFLRSIRDHFRLPGPSGGAMVRLRNEPYHNSCDSKNIATSNSQCIQP